MNIQNNFQGLSQILGTERISESAAPKPAQNAAGAAGSNDEAHLSAAAVAISQTSALPDVRMDKVTAIQAGLAEGSYQVSSSDVAAKLIEHMQMNQK
ncbi:MAG TPA: flagellar biosynthesis anti-sigma factor FlgM [Silvibacterium sp.]|nr:flagellar biosynthesis anti-sigma factor FlgM [Silvibacterium sp.]